MGAQSQPGWAVGSSVDHSGWHLVEGVTVMALAGSRDPWVSWKEGGAQATGAGKSQKGVAVLRGQIDVGVDFFNITFPGPQLESFRSLGGGGGGCPGETARIGFSHLSSLRS